MKVAVEFEELGELPDGWSWQPLQDLVDDPQQSIVDGPFGSSLKASEYVDYGVPIARLQNIDRNRFIDKNIRCITEDKATELIRHRFEPGDILLSKLGDPLGKACIAPSTIGNGVIVADLVRIRPSARRVDRKYLTYAINSPVVARQLEKHTKGTTRPRVNLGVVRQLPIPVAPREKQESIVAEVERQFSRLDEAVANLKRVKANLKRYKSAVLQAAVEGRLVPTEAELAIRDGRAYETGNELLRRVLSTRRSEWKGRAKYKEPAGPDLTKLPNPPEGWTWANFQSVAARVTVGHVGSMKDEYVEKGVPFLRSQNVRENRFDPKGLKFVSERFHRQLGKSALEPGDIVVVRSGSVGVSCVIPDHLRDANCSDLVVIKGPRGVLPAFGAYYMNAVVETRVASGKVGVALTHFNTQSVAELPVPIPPMEEQLRIVAEVDRRLSLAREIEMEVDMSLKRSIGLRESILTLSFSSS